jgi:hypothetical protein
MIAKVSWFIPGQSEKRLQFKLQVFFVYLMYMDDVRFEVSTAVTMMIIIFWEMAPCGSYKNRRFGVSYRLHLQGARVRAGYRAKL